MGSLYLWGRSIQEMGGDVVIGRSIYGVVVIDGSLCSRFYGRGIVLHVKGSGVGGSGCAVHVTYMERTLCCGWLQLHCY